MKPIKIAFYKGRSRIFNRMVSWFTRGLYSHCELITGSTQDGAVCWSSSFMDGGVRAKLIALDPEHWDVLTIDIPDYVADRAELWFRDHVSQPYDVFGLVGFVWRPCADDKSRWFCSEAVAASLGFEQSWRLDPNGLHAVLKRFSSK